MNKVNTFIPTRQWWSYKCRNYEYQDDEFNKKHSKSPQRNVSKCVSDNDFDEFIKMYNDPVKGKCHLCGEHFTDSNRPTLDRIDNDIGHKLNNCLLACSECNSLRKRDDEKITRLRIQLIKYCRLNHLNTTISNPDEFHELRRGMVGGLSMVLHRDNRRGITKINRLRYDEVNKTSSGQGPKVISYDTPNIVTNVMGTDASSLYPSVRSSNYHPFIRYHGHRMYMEGSLTNFYKCYNKDGTRNHKVNGICYDIIHSKNQFKSNPKSVFRATVKLECPRCKINDFIECPPVWRNLEIENKESVIGSYMYNYGKTNKMSSIDKVDTKLTMTLDTMNKFECFGCYELWWLIDHGLVVTDILNLAIYEANTCCHTFVNECMNERQAILSGQKHGNEKFYKISMNGSYGYDGMNTEKYSNVRICNKDDAFRAIFADTFISGSKIDDNNYLIQSNPKSFHCKTCIQESMFTLSNSKYWFLVFIYDFLYKCLDRDRFHINTIETDPIYISISGNINEPNTQGIKYIIKDQEFYNKYAYLFFPNPAINTIQDTKKLLGFCVEKYGDNQIALCPKCYTIFDNEIINGKEQYCTYGLTKALKVKGISLKTNHLIPSDYIDIIDNNTIKQGKNINLQMKSYVNDEGLNTMEMSKIIVQKNALTGFHNKMIILKNQACCPYIMINGKQLSAYNYDVAP